MQMFVFNIKQIIKQAIERKKILFLTTKLRLNQNLVIDQSLIEWIA
jgi:hypothetical protein